jgi:hypothetical protein
MLTAERARELLDYRSDTGEFFWRVPRANGQVPVGSRAGGVAPSGYTVVSLDRVQWKLHRVAWLIAYGSLPDGVIDHINGDKTDNRLANLRDVPTQANHQNRRGPNRDNKVGLLGVSRVSGSGRFNAAIKVNYKQRCLGTFDTPEQAHAAYLEAKRQLHAGCTI